MDPIYLRKLRIGANEPRLRHQNITPNDADVQKNPQTQSAEGENIVHQNSEQSGKNTNLRTQSEQLMRDMRDEMLSPKQFKMNYLASMERASYVKKVMNLPGTLPELLIQLQNPELAKDVKNVMMQAIPTPDSQKDKNNVKDSLTDNQNNKQTDSNTEKNANKPQTNGFQEILVNEENRKQAILKHYNNTPVAGVGVGVGVNNQGVNDTQQPQQPVVNNQGVNDTPQPQAQQPIVNNQGVNDTLQPQPQQPVVNNQPQPQQPAVNNQPQPQAQQPIVNNQGVNDTPQPQPPVVNNQPQPQAQQPVANNQPQPQPQQPVVNTQPQTQAQQPVVNNQPQTQAQQPAVNNQPQPQAQQPVVNNQPQPQAQQPVVNNQPQPQPQQPVVNNQGVNDTQQPQQPVAYSQNNAPQQQQTAVNNHITNDSSRQSAQQPTTNTTPQAQKPVVNNTPQPQVQKPVINNPPKQSVNKPDTTNNQNNHQIKPNNNAPTLNVKIEQNEIIKRPIIHEVQPQKPNINNVLKHNDFRFDNRIAFDNSRQILDARMPIDNRIVQNNLPPIIEHRPIIDDRFNRHHKPHKEPIEPPIEPKSETKQAEAAANLYANLSMNDMQNPTLTQMRQRLSDDAIELLFTGLINLNDLSKTLKHNGQDARSKLIIAMANASKQGIDNSQLAGTMKMVSESMAAEENNPASILKNIIMLYLPWYPLQEGVGFNLSIETMPGSSDFSSLLKVFIQTRNYGNVNGSLVLLSGNAVDMNIQCNEIFPKSDLLERMKDVTQNHSIQSNITVEQRAQMANEMANQQAKVNLSSTYELNPFLLLMAHSFIKNTIIIDSGAKI